MDDALETIARLLEHAALPYVVIGGHAVNVWLEPRFTADVDVAVQATASDTERLKSVLALEGYAAVREHGGDRPKDQIDLRGLVQLPDLDWPHIERWADEWGVVDELRQLRAGPR